MGALYHDEGAIDVYFVKTQALQGLERWDEAVMEMEACVSGIGRDNQKAHEKLHEAKFLVRKAARVDLYAMLGVEFGCKASEKEIRTAYKKRALELHPDRQTGKSDEEKAKAEADFKEIGEALEVLTDPFQKQLWDEGHDLESIKQRVEMRKQQ